MLHLRRTWLATDAGVALCMEWIGQYLLSVEIALELGGAPVSERIYFN